MMPRRRPNRRTNNALIGNRARRVMLLTTKWQPKKTTIEDIRKQVQMKVWERLSR